LLDTLNTPVAASADQRWDLDQAKNWLEQLFTESGSSDTYRYDHSLRVCDRALELASKFHLDHANEIAFSALVHDAAKLYSPDALIDYCQRHGLQLSEDDMASPQTIHPFVGAHMVQEHYGIEPDHPVLEGIRYHTTGRAGMSRLEQLVYIADKLEGNRQNPLYVQKVMALMDFRDVASLDATMLFLLDSTLRFLMDKQQLIHPRTLEARNAFVSLVKMAGHNPRNPVHDAPST
jgi:predicted HD superfamily hydrolase involved in NAD metabolism